MSDEIRSKVATILADAGVTFFASYVRETKRDDWKCDQWMIMLVASSGNRAAGVEFDFFTGLGHRTKMDATLGGKMAMAAFKGCSRDSIAWAELEKAHCKPQAPHAADVLHSVIMDGSACEMSFADWCDNYGYNEDSRKAIATYEACQQDFDKLRKVLTPAQIDALRDALQDY